MTVFGTFNVLVGYEAKKYGILSFIISLSS